MARAVECPACGTKHRVERLPDAPTFRCSSCGQTLRIPPGARAPAPTGARRADGDEPRNGVVPPPRRRPDGANGPVPATASARVAATLPARAEPAVTSAARNGPSRASGTRPTRRRVRWWWRLLAWIVAVPLGLAVTAISAYDLGWIKKDDLLEVFIGAGTDRYTRLAVATIVWALVTAVFVQAFVEGGRWLAERRRARHPSPEVADEPGAAVVAPPPRRTASAVDASR